MNRALLIGSVIGIIAICAIYYLVDPGQTSWALKCPFKMMTGWDCPGCGSQRMIHALLHGEFVEAWHHNAFLMASIPLLIPMGYAEATRHKHPRLYMRIHSVTNIVIFSVAILAWFLFRNLFL